MLLLLCKLARAGEGLAGETAVSKFWKNYIVRQSYSAGMDKREPMSRLPPGFLVALG